eukprot:565772-Pleurochrysis_carterae.AAC.1
MRLLAISQHDAHAHGNLAEPTAPASLAHAVQWLRSCPGDSLPLLHLRPAYAVLLVRACLQSVARSSLITALYGRRLLNTCKSARYEAVDAILGCCAASSQDPAEQATGKSILWDIPNAYMLLVRSPPPSQAA